MPRASNAFFSRRRYEHEEEAADHVAYEVLCAEADGEADDAGARQDRRHVEPELVERDHRDDRPDDDPC